MTNNNNDTRTKTTAKLLEDNNNIIHLTCATKGSDGFTYEQIFYLDFNKLTTTEYSKTYDMWSGVPKEHTKMRLTFEDIPMTTLRKWKEEDD
jgi:hypothetical protein